MKINIHVKSRMGAEGKFYYIYSFQDIADFVLVSLSEESISADGLDI